MKPLVLSGIIDAEPVEEKGGMAHEWRKEKQRLEDEILALRRELDDSRTHNEKLERAMRSLRQSLSPLHRAVRAIFGEVELAVSEEETAAPPPGAISPPAAAAPSRWEHVKQQFPGSPAKIIDALLGQEQMTITQLANFTRMHYDTAKGSVNKLLKAGAVVKEGGVVRLRA